jgi:hypothetical protein
VQFVHVVFSVTLKKDFSDRGVLLYSNKGFTIYNGEGYRGYSSKIYPSFLGLYEDDDVIPYNALLYVSEVLTHGEKVIDFMKKEYNIEYNKILNVIYTNFAQESVFDTIPGKYCVEDHTGMVFHPMDNYWSWL